MRWGSLDTREHESWSSWLGFARNLKSCKTLERLSAWAEWTGACRVRFCVATTRGSLGSWSFRPKSRRAIGRLSGGVVQAEKGSLGLGSASPIRDWNDARVREVGENCAHHVHHILGVHRTARGGQGLPCDRRRRSDTARRCRGENCPRNGVRKIEIYKIYVLFD